MKADRKISISQISQSFSDAFQGVKYAYRSQPNIKIHFLITIPVIFFGILLEINLIEWCLLTLAIGLVLVSELINTAIELSVDFIGADINEKTRKIKDLSAAAVLIATLISIIIASLIFLPKIIIFL